MNVARFFARKKYIITVIYVLGRLFFSFFRLFSFYLIEKEIVFVQGERKRWPCASINLGTRP